MTKHHRGILRAYASADPNAVMAQLQTAFAGFKEKHQGELAEIRAGLDDMAVRLADYPMTSEADGARACRQDQGTPLRRLPQGL